MSNHPFSSHNSPIPKQTQFERDINDLVEQLKKKVNIIYFEFTGHKKPKTWIYGIIKAESLQPENQAGISPDNSSPFSTIKAQSLQPENYEMRLFQEYADKLLEKYSHNLQETEPKNCGEAYQYIREQGEDKVRNENNKPLAITLALWMIDILSVSTKRNLNLVLQKIESLESEVQNFKDFKPPKSPKFFQKNK